MSLTEEQSLERYLYRHLCQGIREFSLLGPGDHVLIGLSGGKDSLAMTELLARFARTHRPSFSLHAIHVRMKDIPYLSDEQFLADFCARNGVEFHLVQTEIAQHEGSKEKPHCFLCSWTRRKILFERAQQMGCNKIALGHHNDDILHTALLNQMFVGSFSTMPVRLQMKKFPVTLIRPLCMIPEQRLEQWATLRQYPQQLKRCPYEHETKRHAARRIYEAMERENPELRYSLWHALKKAGKLVETD